MKKIIMIVMILSLLNFGFINVFAWEPTSGAGTGTGSGSGFDPVIDTPDLYPGSSELVIVSGNYGNKFPDAWNEFMKEWGIIVAGISGAVSLTAFLVLLIQIMQLPIMASHPIKKRQAMMGILWSAVTIALLGSISTVLALFFSVALG